MTFIISFEMCSVFFRLLSLAFDVRTTDQVKADRFILIFSAMKTVQLLTKLISTIIQNYTYLFPCFNYYRLTYSFMRLGKN